MWLIENGHRNSGFSLMTNGGSFHSKMLVHQRVSHTQWIGLREHLQESSMIFMGK